MRIALVFLLFGAAYAQCVPPVQYMPLSAVQHGLQTDGLVALGAYERLSPDGRYILRSFSGSALGAVSLVELPAPDRSELPKAYRTGLSNEAYPVQGTWRYLVDTNGDHFHFKSVLREGPSAKPLFRGGMTGFYAAAAELKSADGRAWIRSLSWPTSEGGQGEGALQVRTIEVSTSNPKILSDTGAQFICRERLAQDGPFYGLPMLSVDGMEFSAMPQAPRQGEQTSRVYRLGNQPEAPRCEQVVELDIASAKATFGAGGDLTYEYRTDVWWFSRTHARDFKLELPHITYASAFPGIADDGRVIFAARWFVKPVASADCGSLARPTGACELQSGYVAVDPLQQRELRELNQAKRVTAPACVTNTTVEAARAAFARFHGL